MSEVNICLVTVTYGQRVAYVLKALESALAEGVHHAVVIDNGSVELVEETLRERFGDWVTVERFARNQGSAPAFKRGLELACDTGCELVLLLDDDNVLTDGCLRKLETARTALAKQHGDNNCMVLACRAGHQPAERIGEISGYLGFHIKNIPLIIAKRIGIWKRVCELEHGGGVVTLPYAPYSGLLLHRSVIQRHGLPDERFIVYADDTEFTYRVTSSGGCIALVREAELGEAEKSWHVSAGRKTFINKLSAAPIDFRVFYAVRNRCYFEQVHLNASGPMRSFNRSVFLTLLWFACAINGSKTNWRLLRRAVSDGENHRLNLSLIPECRLP
jgi:GT2 family glycosyltransferase